MFLILFFVALALIYFGAVLTTMSLIFRALKYICKKGYTTWHRPKFKKTIF